GDTRYVGIDRGTGFYTNKRSILTPDGRLVELAIPDTASFETIFDGQAIVSLVDPLGSFQPGSIVLFDVMQMLAGQKAAPTLVMAPTKSQAVEEVSASDNVLWIKALDDVSGKLFAYERQPDGKWAGRHVKLPANSTIHIVGTADKQDLAFATVEGMLQPTTLVAVGGDSRGGGIVQPTTVGAVGGDPARTIQALPAQFDASQFTVDQRFAASKDGTRVPYFLVRKKGAKAPTGALIHAYGGFRNAQTPTYLTSQPYRSGPLGLFWAEDGGAFVLANIRGGG